MQTDNVKIVTQKKGNKTVHTPSRDASLVVREAVNASRRKISLLTDKYDTSLPYTAGSETAS